MKVGLLFPGYGSQFVGMGKELYDESRIIREYFEEASNCLGINFVKLCFASSDAELSKLLHATTSLFLVSSSLTALLTQAGVQPTIVGGYGIGHYAALFAGNGINFPDGLYLLAKYASLYEEFCAQRSYSMITISGMPGDVLAEICRQATIAEEFAAISAYHTALII